MGLQQPADGAAAGDAARLDLRDADPVARTRRSQVTPRARSARRSLPDPANGRGGAYDDGTRRSEILQTAATLIASSGLRTSLQEIADAAGILPGLLGGAVIVETMFSIKGMGQLAFQATFARDLPVIQALGFVGAVLTLISYLITDLCYAFADSRVSYD